MTTPEQRPPVAVGDHVRSYDFPEFDEEGRCYVEGVVVAITDPETSEWKDCPRVQIRVTRRVFDGEEKKNNPEFVFPPQNGIPTWLDRVTNGIEKIS